MKTFYLAAAFGLVVAFGVRCSAQELKTIETCRAYRAAWFTTANDDIKRLSIKELIHRGEQLLSCQRDVDPDPVKAKMTEDEARKTVLEWIVYPQLTAIYYHEALERATWFIDNKGLMAEFIAKDKSGEIVKSSPEVKK
jgi:hypothetical protein